MLMVARKTSVCTGEYYTYVGDGNYKWLPVKGEVITCSKKCFDTGIGVAYISCTVLMQTLNGPKKMKISKSLKKCSCESGNIAAITHKVTGIRFRNGKISTSVSRKVSGN